MGTNYSNTLTYEHILIQSTTAVLVIVCSEVLSQLENLYFLRKPGRLPADFFFSGCYLRFIPTVSSPTLQQDPQFQPPMEPTDLSLLIPICSFVLVSNPSQHSGKPKGLPIHTFHSVPPDPTLPLKTCSCLPFLYDLIPNGSQRSSFPTFLPPSSCHYPSL